MIYKTEISNQRWWIYDILGNVGWISYIAAFVIMIVKQQYPMNHSNLFCLMSALMVPAFMMIIGIAELLSERIQKLDRILPKTRLYRGFGMLTCGGVLGMIMAAIIISFELIFIKTVSVYLIVMLGGSILCSIFSGLIFRTFHKQ